MFRTSHYFPNSTAERVEDFNSEDNSISLDKGDKKLDKHWTQC